MGIRARMKRARTGSKLLAVLFVAIAMLVATPAAGAITKIPNPPPQPGSFGLEATKPKDPPTRGATITTPSGGSFTKSPIDVSGICPNGLLVQVYDNNVMVGSTMCEKGSFRVKVSLFAGSNTFTAEVYDELGQKGPKSNSVTVKYTNAEFTSFGKLVTLTSNYGRRSAGVGQPLSWPLQLSGGTGPYAFSIDWGDGKAPSLQSQATAGGLVISHTYDQGGIYQVNIRVTDKNGVSAFLQVIAVAGGHTDGTNAITKPDVKTVTKIRILWIPSLITLLLIFPAYWLGRRSELVSLRHQMSKERDSYEEE